MSDASNADLLALTEGYCNGTLGDDEFGRLEKLLLQEKAARAFFRRYLGLDAALHEHGQNAAMHWFPELQARTSVADTARGLATTARRPSDHACDANRGRLTAKLLSIFHPRSGPKRLWAAGVAAIGIIAAAALSTVFFQEKGADTTICMLAQMAGDVRIVAADGEVRAITADSAIKPGEMVRVVGSESSAVIAYSDGTRLTLAGNTSVNCGGDARSKSIVIHQGALAASVEPQESPLLLSTPSAQVQVLGTRFLIEAVANRTDVRVKEGRVRLVRIRDGKTVEVSDGKHAVVTERNKLLVEDIPSLSSTWEVDFEKGLPEGWQYGRWVAEGLPLGSVGAAQAAEEEGNDGEAAYTINSNDAWIQGLFDPQKDSHFHFTFKMEHPNWVNVFLVTRTSDPHAPRFAGNYLFNEFPRVPAGQWLTMTIPLANFKRQHRNAPPLDQAVPFRVIFSSNAPDRGLVIDRIWVTPDGPGKVEVEPRK